MPARWSRFDGRARTEWIEGPPPLQIPKVTTEVAVVTEQNLTMRTVIAPAVSTSQHLGRSIEDFSVAFVTSVVSLLSGASFL